MNKKVTGFNNFCRVFELPEKFSSEYCFGGGITTTFKMVDWFNPLPLPQWAISEDQYKKLIESGDMEESPDHSAEYTESTEADLIAFIQKKKYCINGRKYLVIFNFDHVLIFTCIKPQE